MMNGKTSDVVQYDFTSEDRLFFDANVWLYLYLHQGSDGGYWENLYSDVFDHILGAGSQIYIDVLVVSEFINAFARQVWKASGLFPKDFKKFRNTPEFEPVAQNIAAAVEKMMQYSSRVESRFPTLDMNKLLRDYATGSLDFNDQVIVEICRRNRFTLVTNDGDFRNQDIPILTANRRLLRP